MQTLRSQKPDFRQNPYAIASSSILLQKRLIFHHIANWHQRVPSVTAKCFLIWGNSCSGRSQAHAHPLAVDGGQVRVLEHPNHVPSKTESTPRAFAMNTKNSRRNSFLGRLSVSSLFQRNVMKTVYCSTHLSGNKWQLVCGALGG